MIFKEDWEKCQERFDAFWEGEMVDRCCIAVTAPRNTPLDGKPPVREAGSLQEQWLDIDFRYQNALASFARTFYGGEAFPNFMINLGPGAVAAFMGGTYTLMDSTVWFGSGPQGSEWDTLLKAELREDSDLFQIAQAMTEYACSRAGGDYMVCNTDLGGTLDIAAALRTTEQLLTDLYDYPDEVKAFRDRIDDIWLTCYDRFQNVINRYQEGTTDWYPSWKRGKRSYPLQCDFAAMISPKQFEEFVVPSLEKQAAAMDGATYHLDGVGEIPHLDQLLSIDAIKGIQWVPGDGKPGGCDERWFPLYKRIQEKGRRLIIPYIENHRIEKLLQNISPKGVFIQTSCSSEDEARELLKAVEKWSVRAG